jgi:hypothetical protein
MSEQPGAHLDEEPQEERGPMGARDTGSDEPSGGPVDRPAGTADEESDTAIQPQEAQDPDAPNLQSGGG